jgi:hypothetical protein
MMGDDAISLCPMCRMAPVTRSRRQLARLAVGPLECPVCGAQYRRVTRRRIKLTWANPQKIVAMGASANPMAPPAHGFRGFYLDQALPRDEWERIAAGRESDAFEHWVATSTRYAHGDLPILPPPAGVVLREGESVHHVAYPTWLSVTDDPISGADPTPGMLVITNQRLLFQTDRLLYGVAWSEVDSVTETPPAIVVHDSRVPEPVVCYVPPLDPAFGAVKGAWLRGRISGRSL